MIDFHSHILPNIDDGSRNFEETINLIKEAKMAGFTKIISTSHYIKNYYESSESERTQLLQESYKPELGVELYIGNEIFITDDIIGLIKEGKASTINKSKYILFELPMSTKPLNVKEVVYRLIENGYRPIIAHPERYLYVQEDIMYVKELADMGTLFQANYGSIIGLYGNKAKKTVKKLLKQDLIHFLGSDVHRTNHIYTQIPRIMKKLNKVISKQKIEELTNINPQNVLDGIDL